jgi:hypothetical protein
MTPAELFEALKVIALGLSLLTLGTAWFYVKGISHE